MRRRALVVVGVFLGAWLTFDGLWALVTGDYVTPASGRHAGELGPWASLVAAAGLEPRSVLVKIAHVTLGLLWIGGVGGVVFGSPWAERILVAVAILSLWYLPFGTVIGAVVLGVLLWPGSLGSRHAKP